ncbi:acyl-CoA synthetase (AMP-forming)/AMP-acid ligase II [Stackebrandtia endophytica]|uniref:Acyl-CoA synthetase (AMP-forming)/AMP-acid ligase II n=1 Tax=Stackebrandtia endophytica TaxID=1496996 RepID=A0A543ARX1_9ACTN|nr:class I adenylate-forming enzyme family protein [Stackebrandtia endophytica]TQL75327.1 acyl-CoA synthetase (AMP-forming)/AMP-acid ligase II [Stackebrandtia endophytica]
MSSVEGDKDGFVSVPGLLRARASRYPQQSPLLVAGSVPLTYGGWDLHSDMVAGALARRGVSSGDNVGLVFGGMDWINYAIGYLGVLKTGATAVHLAADLDHAELRRRVEQTGVVGIVGGVRQPLWGRYDHRWWISVAELISIGGWPTEPRIRGEDIAEVLYTSGTTGPAKAMVNPHGNLAFGHSRAASQTFDDTQPMLAPMPLGTPSSASIAGMFAVTTKTTIIVCDPRDIQGIGELVERHRVGSLMLTPWLAMQLIAAQEVSPRDLSSVTMIGIASAPLPASVGNGLLRVMPQAKINTAYAQSEAVPAVVLNQYDPKRPRAVGKPGPGTELRVVNDAEQEVEPGTLGEIWLRASAPRRRYLGRPARDGDEWTKTKDLGYIEDDVLYLFDRASDTILTNEQLVSSIDVEEALYEHPAVTQAAAFAIVDRVGNQRVAAAVVTRPDRHTADLSDFVAARLNRHERPQFIQRLPTLPRGITGKVLKHRLRRQFIG